MAGFSTKQPRGGGSGGGGTWGSITGTLSNQTDLQNALNAKADDSGVVHDTGAETVAGVKTFSSDPIIPDEAYGATWNGSQEPATKNALYDKIESLSATTLDSLSDVVITTPSSGQVLKYNGSNWVNDTDATGAGGVVALDLGDNGVNESSALSEIATSNDTNSIFTEPTADKLLIDVSKNWPTADALAGVTASSAELNILDGATLSTAELNYVDGVTSAIQTQLNGKASTTHTHTASDVTDFTEAAQDAVGTILTDSTEIDFTYTDATPSIAASIKSGSIDETKLDTSVNASLNLADSATQPGDAITTLDGTAWRTLYTDASGDITELAFGTSGQVLTSNGASSAPSWQTPSGGIGGSTGSTDNAIIRASGTGGSTIDASTKWAIDDNGLMSATITTGQGFSLISSLGTGTGNDNLLYLKTTNAAWDRPIIRVESNATGGGAVDIRIDSPNPDIELIETDQTAPAGVFELAVNSDTFQINGRNAANTSFEPIATFWRYADGSMMGLGTAYDIPNAMLEVVSVSSNDYLNLSTSVGANSGSILNVNGG